MRGTDQIAKIFSHPIKLLIVLSALFLFLLTIGFSYISAVGYAQDKVALGDVVEIQKFLDQYRADTQFYPPATNGQPVGFEKYLSGIPKSAVSCSSTQNLYLYEQLDAGISYKLSFCLNHGTSGFHSGLNSVGPNRS